MTENHRQWTTIDPVTGKSLSTYSYVDQTEIENVISALSDAFSDWSILTVQQRQSVLHVLVERLQADKNKVADLITFEMGKPIKESLAEVEKCITTIQGYISSNATVLQKKTIQSIYKKSEISAAPLGVIYGIMPWNFPLFQAVRMFMPTLISGNVVLLKHSEITPLVGEYINQLFQSVWRKPILKHVLIDPSDTEFVLSNKKVGGVSLTGSVRAGFSVSALAGKYLKKSVFELGGSDPCLVLADASLQNAVVQIAKARLMNTGQSCICIKRCLVDRKVLPEFLDLLKSEFAKYKIGDPKDKKTDLGPLSHPKFKVSLQKQIEQMQNMTDAKNVFSLKAESADQQSGFVDASIYLVEKNHAWFSDQEFFAPVLVVIPFDSVDEAIEIANSTEFALGATIWTQSLQTAESVASRLVAGQIAINDMIKSDLTLPFGGFKKSGLGRELGDDGFLSFTESKVISFS